MKRDILIIGRFIFDHQGFDITYSTQQRQTTHLMLCPKALCQLLEDAKLIEGFDIDENGEPVILFENDPVKTTYGFDRWNSFIRTFPLSYRMAIKLLEFKIEREDHQAFQTRIDNLLQPLNAA